MTEDPNEHDRKHFERLHPWLTPQEGSTNRRCLRQARLLNMLLRLHELHTSKSQQASETALGRTSTNMESCTDATVHGAPMRTRQFSTPHMRAIRQHQVQRRVLEGCSHQVCSGRKKCAYHACKQSVKSVSAHVHRAMPCNARSLVQQFGARWQRAQPVKARPRQSGSEQPLDAGLGGTNSTPKTKVFCLNLAPDEC